MHRFTNDIAWLFLQNDAIDAELARLCSGPRTPELQDMIGRLLQDKESYERQIDLLVFKAIRLN